MQSDWLEMLAKEGTVPAVTMSQGDADKDAEPPCPACGTAAPLVEGECSECGLFLGE